MSRSLLKIYLRDAATALLKRSWAEALSLGKQKERTPRLSTEPTRVPKGPSACGAGLALRLPHRFSTADPRFGSGGQGQISSGKIPARAHLYRHRPEINKPRDPAASLISGAGKKARGGEQSTYTPWSLPLGARDVPRGCPRVHKGCSLSSQLRPRASPSCAFLGEMEYGEGTSSLVAGSPGGAGGGRRGQQQPGTHQARALCAREQNVWPGLPSCQPLGAGDALSNFTPARVKLL